MKKPLLMLLFMVSVTMAKAQSSLYVYMNNGEDSETIALADIGKITFEEGYAVITPKEGGQKSFPLADVKNFRFTPDEVSAILAHSGAGARALVTVRAGVVHVAGWDGSRKAALMVYGTGGQLLYANGNWRGEDIDISYLPKGVYIIKIENQSTKIRK